MAIWRIVACTVLDCFLVSITLGSYPDRTECPLTHTGFIGSGPSKVDKSSGQTFITSDPDYAFTCCGVIREWKAIFTADGYIRFQVWRRNLKMRTRTYELVGQNLHHVKEGDVGFVTSFEIHPHRRISVSPGDVIGWQFVGPEIIPYEYHNMTVRGRGFWVQKEGLMSSGDLVEVGTGDFLHHRKYIIAAQPEKNQKPFFLTEEGEDIMKIYINDTYHVGSLVYQVNVMDNDTYDEHLLVIAMVTKTDYFTFQESTRSVRLRRRVRKGVYHLSLRVTDQCEDHSTLHLHVKVTESHPHTGDRRGRPALVYIVGGSVSVVIALITFIVAFLYTYRKWKKENRVHHHPGWITLSKLCSTRQAA